MDSFILAIVCVVAGLLMWCLLPPKAAEIGRILFFVGAFAIVVGAMHPRLP